MARLLEPQRESVPAALAGGRCPTRPRPERATCARSARASWTSLLARLARGEAEELLAEEALEAAAVLRAGSACWSRARAVARLDRCCLAVLDSGSDRAIRRLESVLAAARAAARAAWRCLLRAQRGGEAPALLEPRSRRPAGRGRGARAGARERGAAPVRAQSQHRAEQIALLSAVVHRIAAILDPERLMQEAAEVIQARMNHTYVAVVVLDDEGVLVGPLGGTGGRGPPQRGPRPGSGGRRDRARAAQARAAGGRAT